MSNRTTKRKTVFTLTDGDYSDYHIIGIYSSREAARVVRDKVGGDIEEVELDAGVEDINAGLEPWSILMLHDGTVESAKPKEEMSSYDIGGSVLIWQRSKAPAYQGKNVPDAMRATVWAKNKTHAVKIVNEHRRQWIAEGRWE